MSKPVGRITLDVSTYDGLHLLTALCKALPDVTVVRIDRAEGPTTPPTNPLGDEPVGLLKTTGVHEMQFHVA